MGRMKTIKEDVLRGIAAALATHAPHLVPTLHEIMRRGLVEGRTGQIGSSIYGKLTTTVAWGDGEPILRALESIERIHGYNALFADRQINWLVICWRQFVEPTPIPPSP